MAISKKLREQVKMKYGGLCAYTGKPLGDDWQVDHVTPISEFIYQRLPGDPNSIDNLLPCLRIINHYKRSKDLYFWRRYISTLHIRLAKLPKKTIVDRTENRKRYLLEVADHFGITPDKPFSGKFYFETL